MLIIDDSSMIIVFQKLSAHDQRRSSSILDDKRLKIMNIDSVFRKTINKRCVIGDYQSIMINIHSE